MCKVFTSPARIRLLDALRDRERSVGELADALDLPQPNVSQHLMLMRSHGVVLARREGKRVRYRLSNPKFLKAFDIIREALLESLQKDARLASR